MTGNSRTYIHTSQVGRDEHTAAASVPCVYRETLGSRGYLTLKCSCDSLMLKGRLLYSVHLDFIRCFDLLYTMMCIKYWFMLTVY